MDFTFPKIIQGGMGAGVSNWRLAQAVSRIGQLGVVSGTGLDQIFLRRLQDGDPGGDLRRALSHFPFPKMAQRLLDAYFIPGGRKEGEPYRCGSTHTLDPKRQPLETCILANFAEVYLARWGHDNPVGINYLEKIQLPHLPSLYGAMLAGVSVVIMGAGIPLEIPGALDALARHQVASYPIQVTGAAAGAGFRIRFDPAEFIEQDGTLPELTRPVFLPIVSSDILATIMLRKANGSIQGFVVEGACAGGHNAPPRGGMKLDAGGEPIYGPRDACDLAVMRSLGLPFWLAGGQGSAEALRAAVAAGASGVQVGTPFALCLESGFPAQIRRALIDSALAGRAKVMTDPVASPTGFPFKVARLAGSLSEPEVYAARTRRCDLGFLREIYLRDDGSIGYRCAAEPEVAYVAKGGKADQTVGRKCLCNALMANIGVAQRRGNGFAELPLVTLGDDVVGVGRFCTAGYPDYSAADVVRVILG